MAQETTSVCWTNAGVRFAFSVNCVDLSVKFHNLLGPHSTNFPALCRLCCWSQVNAVRPTFNNCVCLVSAALPSYGFALTKFTEFQPLQADSKSGQLHPTPQVHTDHSSEPFAFHFQIFWHQSKDIFNLSWHIVNVGSLISSYIVSYLLFVSSFFILFNNCFTSSLMYE